MMSAPLTQVVCPECGLIMEHSDIGYMHMRTVHAYPDEDASSCLRTMAHTITRKTETPMSAVDALDEIHAMMDGTEWEIDMLDYIGMILERTGRVVREPL